MGRVEDKIEYLKSSNILDDKKPYFVPATNFVRQKIHHYAVLVTYPVTSSFVPNIPVDREKTLIWVESGGFAVSPPLNYRIVLRRQLRLRPDICLTLDQNVKREDLTIEEANERIEDTIKNASRALMFKDEMRTRYNHEFELAAVIQGYNLDTVEWCAESMKEMEFKYYALGAIPTTSTRDINETIKWCESVRKIIGTDSWLHVLGMGNKNILYYIKEYIDSFDVFIRDPFETYPKRYNDTIWNPQFTPDRYAKQLPIALQ